MILQSIVVLVVATVVVFACYFTWQVAITINQPTPTPVPTETPSLTPTPTPTLPNTNFIAVSKEESNCFSGTSLEYQVLTTIPQFQAVMIIGKNSNGDWFLTRWNKFSIDCWVETSQLAPDFDINVLSILSTPSAPTFTPTPTKVVVIINPTREPSNNSKTPVPPPTNTPVPPPTNTPVPPPTNTPIPPTNTPVPPPTNTPVPPPTKTNTPSGPRACNDGIDNDNDGYIDGADPQCRNNGDDDESQ